ncbi:Nudix hydrolase [Musa troglodytarum]|uniref:Nudix hydrolase n=1 Tax=Musa troglodytarum TaxID=320322 RepID=A0A9E7ECW6_9LILI|nr:Nudix hydrolase [Musa troglodytarum]
MVSLVSRQGRQLQRYTKSGGRLVVGCIPYKFCPGGEGLDKSMEVLVISSPKGNGLLFPKGGWETDETIKEAASREALEEAGVQGNVERKLGRWRYKSRTYDAYYEGTMFPLNVTEELGDWPEMHVRQRKWVTVAEAREGCQHPWMKEALERLVKRLSNSGRRSSSSSSTIAAS